MTASTPPLDFGHQKGYKIPTKHKEAIRQLHWFGKVPKLQLQERYKLHDTTINRILAFYRNNSPTSPCRRALIYGGGQLSSRPQVNP